MVQECSGTIASPKVSISGRLPLGMQMGLGFVAGAALFYLLGRFGVPGGDSELILDRRWSFLWSFKLVYYPPEPLAHAAVHSIYSFLPDITASFRIASALWGGLYVALLILWSARLSFLLINLVSAVTLLFIGHVEYYAAVAALLVLALYLLARLTDGQTQVRPYHVAAAFALAWFGHKLAMFYTPALVWLAIQYKSGSGWKKRQWPARDWQLTLAVLIAALVIDMIPQFIDFFDYSPILVVRRGDPVWENITPPTQALADLIAAHSKSGAFFLFTLGQWAHWKYYLFFLLIGAPLGLPLCLLWRDWLRNPMGRALATAALCSLIWTFLWHPHMAYMDWDLFCVGAIPINLLAGWLWIRRHPSGVNLFPRS